MILVTAEGKLAEDATDIQRMSSESIANSAAFIVLCAAKKEAVKTDPDIDGEAKRPWRINAENVLISRNVQVNVMKKADGRDGSTEVETVRSKSVPVKGKEKDPKHGDSVASVETV